MSVIGTSQHRHGGRDRVTGSQQYLADLPLEGALHAKLVTLDCARARIDRVDTEEADALSGVHFVLTRDDLPRPMPRFGYGRRDRPVMADGETKYHGEPVALVVADSREIAEAGAALVRVEHEVLPAVSTLDQALDPGSPLVQDPALRPGDPLAESNLLCEYRFGWGDVEAAEAGADLVVDETYEWPMQTHFAIEPHGFAAAPRDDGGLTVWSTVQHPYQLQKALASVFELPLSKVRVVAPDPGGGFGGKQHAKLEPLVAFAARRAGGPVRLVLTLEEAFQAVRRASARTRFRSGFEADGTLVFQDVAIDWLAGAYTDSAARAASKGAYFAAGPYRAPAVRIVSRAHFSHTTPTHPYRGFAFPQHTWARESNLEAASRDLGIDPVELRLRNLVKYQEECVPGCLPADGDWQQTLRKAAEEIGWGSEPGTGVGRGIAVGLKPGPTTGLSTSRIRLLADGSAVLYCGTSDMGQGARTVFAQIAAQELGVPPERISVVMGDTDAVPYDQQTSASRSTVLMGNAVLRACRDVQGKIAQMAAGLFGGDPEDFTVEDGEVVHAGERIPLVEVMQRGLGRLGGEVAGGGEMRTAVDPDHPLGGPPVFYMFNATAVEVRVDEETGLVEIVDYVTVSDVGRALNPTQTAGQDDGSAVMSTGWALMEHLILDDEGRTRNLGAIDYRIPTSNDLPTRYRSFRIENGDGPGPYGAKGMSEGAVLATAPAVAAAIRDATGAVIRDLPMSPERVWRALQERDGAD
jgi:CO/xanthine dehydrogenase Mo-binding subunit